MIRYFLIYLLLINLLSLLLFGVDKKRAQQAAAAAPRGRGKKQSGRGKKASAKHPPKRRIPEKTLFITAILGGSIGAIAGMFLFHHKIRNPLFLYGMPAILLLQLLVVWVAVRGI